MIVPKIDAVYSCAASARISKTEIRFQSPTVARVPLLSSRQSAKWKLRPQTWPSFVVVKFMEAYTRLAGQIHDRQDKKRERDYEQNSDSIFMLQPEEGAREGHDN